MKKNTRYVSYEIKQGIILLKKQNFYWLKNTRYVNFDLTFSLKTPLGETGCLCNPYFLLTVCLGIQYFDSPLCPNTVK